MKCLMLQIRGGVERDRHGKKAGKGALITEGRAPTLGVSQDATLFQIGGGMTIKQSFGINPQGGQMLPFDKECGETLAIGHQGGVMTEQETIGFKAGQSKDGGLGDEREVSPTLSHKPSALEPTMAQSLQGISHMKYIVRRLTPVECERLMGLPDGWTIPKNLVITDALVEEFREKHDTFKRIMAEYDGLPMPKPTSAAQVRKWLEKITNPETCPDAPRYKACGNGWATNQPRWILTRLLSLEGGVEW